MKANAIIFWVCLIFFQIQNVYAFGEEANLASIFETLSRENNPTYELTTDLLEIMENRRNEEYHNASLKGADGQTWNLKVKVRGKFRRRICEMPPLKLKFSKSGLKAAGLSDLNEIKLVTSCSSDKKAGDWVTREHLAYQMFNQASPISFRSSLITIIFKDSHVENMEIKMQCMLVEHIEELTTRLNCTEVEAFGLGPDSLHTHQSALVSMFNYMIGNTDWEVAGARNVKFIRSKTDPTAKILIVPYDFDFAGMVNTDYAVPNSQTGLLTVRERFLMADGIPYESLKRAAVTLAGLQEEFYSTCSSKNLTRNSQNEVKEYIKSFFEVLANQQTETLMRPPAMD